MKYYVPSLDVKLESLAVQEKGNRYIQFPLLVPAESSQLKAYFLLVAKED